MGKRRKQIEQSKPPLSTEAWEFIGWVIVLSGFVIYLILKMV